MATNLNPNDLSNASLDDLIALESTLNLNPTTQEVTQPTPVATNPNVPDQEFEMDDLDSKNDWIQQARTIYNYENKDKKFKGEMIELMSNVLLELYKAFWFRRSFWQSEIKRAK